MKQAEALFTRWEDDPLSQILQTRMKRFESTTGIDGLARENNAGMIEVLAVYSRKPGSGGFRKFIAELKTRFQTICIWHVDNPFLPEVLVRYGFRFEETVDEHGDFLTGYRWDNLRTRPDASTY